MHSRADAYGTPSEVYSNCGVCCKRPVQLAHWAQAANGMLSATAWHVHGKHLHHLWCTASLTLCGDLPVLQLLPVGGSFLRGGPASCQACRGSRGLAGIRAATLYLQPAHAPCMGLECCLSLPGGHHTGYAHRLPAAAPVCRAHAARRCPMRKHAQARHSLARERSMLHIVRQEMHLPSDPSERARTRCRCLQAP